MKELKALDCEKDVMASLGIKKSLHRRVVSAREKKKKVSRVDEILTQAYFKEITAGSKKILQGPSAVLS